MMTRSRGGNRCCALRKLSRNRRFSRFLLTAVGICFRAIANPSRGNSPFFFPTRMVMQASEHRKLLLKTCLNSEARVSLSRLGKDSLDSAPTLRGKTRSTFRPTRLDNASATAGLHARTEAMRSGTLDFTGLKCTFHVKRLGSLVCRFQQGATMYCYGRATSIHNYACEPLIVEFVGRSGLRAN